MVSFMSVRSSWYPVLVFSLLFFFLGMVAKNFSKNPLFVVRKDLQKYVIYPLYKHKIVNKSLYDFSSGDKIFVYKNSIESEVCVIKMNFLVVIQTRPFVSLGIDVESLPYFLELLPLFGRKGYVLKSSNSDVETPVCQERPEVYYGT